MNVELWNGKKLREKTKVAIKKWPSHSSGFINGRYATLIMKKLIELYIPMENRETRAQAIFAQRAGVANSCLHLTRPSLEIPSRKQLSQRDDYSFHYIPCAIPHDQKSKLRRTHRSKIPIAPLSGGGARKSPTTETGVDTKAASTK